MDSNDNNPIFLLNLKISLPVSGARNYLYMEVTFSSGRKGSEMLKASKFTMLKYKKKFNCDFSEKY